MHNFEYENCTKEFIETYKAMRVEQYLRFPNIKENTIKAFKKYLELVLTAIFLSSWNFACFTNIWVLRNCHSPSAFGRIAFGELVS